MSAEPYLVAVLLPQVLVEDLLLAEVLVADVALLADARGQLGRLLGAQLHCNAPTILTQLKLVLALVFR